MGVVDRERRRVKRESEGEYIANIYIYIYVYTHIHIHTTSSSTPHTLLLSLHARLPNIIIMHTFMNTTTVYIYSNFIVYAIDIPY